MIERAAPGTSIFDVDAEALANPVNCLGTAGAGLAQHFARVMPRANEAYRTACRRRTVRPGRVLLLERQDRHPARMLAFPTKDDWRRPSRMEWIEAGLDSLRVLLDAGEIASIALPALGCGLGGLDWPLVEAAIDGKLQTSNARIVVVPPAPPRTRSRRR